LWNPRSELNQEAQFLTNLMLKDKTGKHINLKKNYKVKTIVIKKKQLSNLIGKQKYKMRRKKWGEKEYVNVFKKTNTTRTFLSTPFFIVNFEI